MWRVSQSHWTADVSAGVSRAALALQVIKRVRALLENLARLLVQVVGALVGDVNFLVDLPHCLGDAAPLAGVAVLADERVVGRGRCTPECGKVDGKEP
jgi:hypothetical protein